MKVYVKLLTLSFIFGLIFYFSYRTADFLSDVILIMGFQNYEIFIGETFKLVQFLLPFILFQMLFGTYIYQHFCTASIYHFTRINNRIKWFLKESVNLLIYCVSYVILLVVFTTVFFEISNTLTYDKESFIILVCYVLINSLFLFFITLLTNILSINFKSHVGFMISNGFVLACISIFIYWDDKLAFYKTENINIEDIQSDGKLIQLNPISHLVIKWHSSNIETVNERINQFGINFDLYSSVVLFLLLSILTIIVGCLIVKNKDFIITNTETGD